HTRTHWTADMPRRARGNTAGFVYHVLNRAVRRSTLFDTNGDYATLERALGQALHRVPVRLLAYCVMPTHFHLIVWPLGDRDLSYFMHRLTMTHAQRWHARRGSGGTGAVY